MSTTTPGVKNATTDDAPTLEPTMTMAVTHATANGATGELLEFDEYACVVTCATDTIARVVEDSQ